MKRVMTALKALVVLGVLWGMPCSLEAQESGSPAEQAQLGKELASDLKLDFPAFEGEAISLVDAGRMAAAQSIGIRVLKLENESKRLDIKRSRSIYDPVLTVEGDYIADEREPASPVFGARTVSGLVRTSVQQKLPIGSVLTLTHTASRESTQSAFATLPRYYEGAGSVGIAQPLLRNSFGIINRAELDKIKLDVRRFDYQTMDAIEAAVFEVRSAYWDLVFAELNLESKKKALEQAQAFLKTMQSKLDIGLVEEQHVYGAEANVRRRVLEAHEALLQRQSGEEVLNVLLDLPVGTHLIPATDPGFEEMYVDAKMSLRTAFERRRDYKSLELEAEKARLDLKIKRSALWPQLDLEATYRGNGLDRELWDAQGEAYGFDHPTLTAGFYFRFPLWNREASSRRTQAKIAKKRILLLMEQTQKRIEQQIREASRDVKLAAERVRQTQHIQTLERKKFNAEEKDFQLGRSDSQTVIDFQEDLILADTAAQQAIVAYQQAVDALLRFENTLLTETGLLEAVLE